MLKQTSYISVSIVYIFFFIWAGAAFYFNGIIPYFVCPFKYIVGVPCLFCGLTRSCALLLKGNFVEALRMNCLIILIPIIALLNIVICIRNIVYKQTNQSKE